MNQIGVMQKAVEDLDEETRTIVLDEALHLATHPANALKMAVWRVALESIPAELQVHYLEVVTAMAKRFPLSPPNKHISETEMQQLVDAYVRTPPEGRKRIHRLVLDFAGCFPVKPALRLVSSSCGAPPGKSPTSLKTKSSRPRGKRPLVLVR